MVALALVTLVMWLLSLGAAVSVFRCRGLRSKVRRLFLAAVGAVAGVFLLSLLLVLHAFHAFAGQTLIARVTVKPLAQEEFALTYTPVTASGAAASVRTFRLRGDQWAISGGIVRWHPWLTALGLPSHHKPLRISGQFSSVERQRASLPTAYPLEPGTDLVWEWFYRLDPYLPFVEAVYGSSAYAYTHPPDTHTIYVTPSGYMIKRR